MNYETVWIIAKTFLNKEICLSFLSEDTVRIHAKHFQLIVAILFIFVRENKYRCVIHLIVSCWY